MDMKDLKLALCWNRNLIALQRIKFIDTIFSPFNFIEASSDKVEVLLITATKTKELWIAE